MSKPRVVIASLSEKNGQVIRNQLNDLFGDIIIFDCVSNENGMDSIIQADLVLASAKTISNIIVKFLMPDTDMIVIRRTIHKDSWDKLDSIAIGTKALLVNDDQEVTMETISLLYELGIKHIALIPYYPGIGIYPEVDMAITPNEKQLVPDSIKTIFNIGARIIDSSTIFDMLNKLDMLNKNTSIRVINHMNKTISRSPGLLATLNMITERKRHLELILNVSNDAIIAFNENNKIIIFNKKAEDYFQIASLMVIGKTLEEVFHKKQYKKDLLAKKIEDEVLNINNSSFVVNKYLLKDNLKFLGGVITLKESNEIQRLEFKFRYNNKKRGHVAKYTFPTIVGKSIKIHNTISTAKRFAIADSAILIQGESGTGKELFAQAIHLSSKRKDKPFVAFNCASLTDSLIESELFGYVGGAFTGARKEGKPGLFELAHEGTLFLDEIGDVSYNVQARLLRVLQEKEVIRVGGIDIMPVDIRVISATNKDLLELVEKEKFRLDLFYRLNILPLSIPPLRKRKGDIPYLIDYILNKHEVKRDVSNEVMNIFKEYDWPGNIRELENCIEYMINTNDYIFESKNLPPYLLNNRTNKCIEDIEPINVNEVSIILEVLKEASINGEKIGRKTICERLEKYGLNLSEQEVRSRIKKLREEGLVIVGRGRAATKISSEGLNHLSKLH